MIMGNVFEDGIRSSSFQYQLKDGAKSTFSSNMFTVMGTFMKYNVLSAIFWQLQSLKHLD